MGIEWVEGVPYSNFSIEALEKQILAVEGVVVFFRHPKKAMVQVSHHKGYFRYLNNPVGDDAKVRDVLKRIARITKDQFEFVAIRPDGTIALQTDRVNTIKRNVE